MKVNARGETSAKVKETTKGKKQSPMELPICYT